MLKNKDYSLLLLDGIAFLPPGDPGILFLLTNCEVFL